MTSATAPDLATRAPKQLVPALVRFAVAVAVSAALTVVWVAAESESHRAVDAATEAISPSHVDAPAVQVIVTRSAKPHST